MSRNGSGTYNLPAGNPVITGTTISTTWANTTLTDIGTALTGSVASDGQTPMTGSLNLNTNKIVNLGTPTADQDAATKVYVDTAGGLALLKASNLSDVANATTSRTNLGLGSIATQAASAVAITGGTITGITDLTVADGGTGVSTIAANAVVLGNGTSAIQTVAPSTNGNVLTSNGTTWTSAAIPSSGVTSAVAGNGISVSGATGAVTFAAACPTFNSVGSYVFGKTLANGAGELVASGSTMAAGTGTQQIESTATDVSGSQTRESNNLSGTWRNMSLGGATGIVGGTFQIVACRVS
jgi:hypothetical protein